MGIFKRTKDSELHRDTNSRTTKPIVLEKLEPRILLSGDGLLNISPNPLDTLLDNTSQVIQYAELLDTDARAEEQVPSELSDSNIYEPILTLSGDDTNGESDDPELSAQIIGPTQLDSEPDLQLAGSDVDIALVVGGDLFEDNGAQPIGEDVDSECFESCQRQLIIEQLTETLRIPHGPPGAEGVLTSLDDVQSEYLLSGEPTTPASNDVIPLNEADLNSILDEAIHRWTATGLVSDAGVFTDVSLVIADLPIGVLGQTEANVISIDITADGNGWFVDLTPADDSEFVLGNDGRLRASTDGPAAGRMDLLTVILHELGHVAGFGHTDRLANDGPDVMRYFINTDVRLSVNASAEPLQSGFALDFPAFAIDDPKLNDVIDNILAIYFDPAIVYSGSYEFNSGETINGYVIPEFMNIGDTIGDGYADLEIQDVTLTFSDMEHDGSSWTGWVEVEAESATLFPGLLNIVVTENDDDLDSFAVVGLINLAEGNPNSSLDLDDIDVVEIGWPGFLSVTITELKLEFQDFRGDEDHIDNTLHLKVELAGFDFDIGVVALSIAGSASVDLYIEQIEDDLAGSSGDLQAIMKAALATAMATDLTDLEGHISGEIFKVGSLSADFTYQTVTYDPDGPDERSVVYLAVRGSLSIGEAIAGDDGDGGGGFGGFGFAFAISELGPLHFFAYVDVPITLEPVSGLAISSMNLGVMFNTTIEDLQTETDFTIDADDVARDGTTITLTIPDHDFEVGDEFKIRKAGNEAYNGKFTVVSTTESTITYVVDSDPGPFGGSAAAEIIRLTIKDPLDLDDDGLQSGVDTPDDFDDWLGQLKDRVLDQIGDGGDVEDIKAAWDRIFGKVVLGGGASLSFDPRIPEMLMSFEVKFLLGIGLGFDTEPLLQIFLSGEMSLLDGTVSFTNTRLYADLSDLFSGDGKFLYLQTQGEIDVPIPGTEDIEPLLVYRGEVSFETFLVGDDVLDALVIDDTASGYWTVVLTLDDTSGYSTDDSDNENEIAVFDSNPFTFGGTYEVIEIDDIANTITYRIYCDLDGENGCSEEEIAATNPGTWVSGESYAKVAKKNDLGGGFRISLGGGVDLNIPGINADFEPILVTTLTLETIGDDVTISFIVPPGSAEEEFRIELSFAVALSETHVGAIATAAGKFVMALDLDAPADEFIIIYGAAWLGTEFHFLEKVGLFIDASGLLQINTGEATSIELHGGLEVNLPAKSFAIRLDGSVDFCIDFVGDGLDKEDDSVFLIEGIFVLEFSAEQGFNVALFRDIGGGSVGPATLQLGPANCRFLTFDVFGFLAIRSDGFAANLILSVHIGAPGPLSGLISLDADFVFIMNTTGRKIEFVIPEIPDGSSNPGDGRDPGLTLTIPEGGPADPAAVFHDFDLEALIEGNAWDEDDMATAGPYGVLFVDGHLTLLYVVTLKASGYVSLTPDLMEMRVEVSGSFLKLFNVSGSAFINSNGEFEFIVDGNVYLGWDGFNIGGSAHLEVSYLDKILNVEGWVTATGEIFWIDFTLFKLGISYNSVTGDIKLSVGPVPVPAIGWYCFWGICVPYPTIKWKYYTFTIGTLKVVEQPPPPVELGWVSNGILTLYVGPEAGNRNLCGDDPDEDVLIERVSAGSEEGEKIRITMFGHSQVFDNVFEILIPDMADGEDSVEIRAGVTIPVEAHLGDDDDILISYGSGIVTAYGDEDNDRLEGGSANDQLFGGNGKDTIDGKAGDDWIEGGGGADVLIGGAGSDTIIGGGGVDMIAGDLTLFPPVLDPPDLVADAQEVDSGGWNLSANDEITDATDLPHISIPGTGDGTFDYYSFTVTGSNQRGIFDIDVENFNTQLFLYDSNGNLLTHNDDNGSDPGNGTSGASLIEYEFSEAGTYIIGVGKYASFNVVGEGDIGQIGGNAPDEGDVYTLHISLEGHALNSEGTDPVSELEPNQPLPPVQPDSFVFQTMASETEGDDTLEGGDGADIILGGSGNDQINGGDGEDLLIGDDGIVTFSEEGMTYELTYLGYSGNDIIDGGADNDTLFGQKGEDILIGGIGDDFLYGDAYALGTETTGNILLGDDGTIMINGIVTVDTSGEAAGGSDTIWGNGGADIVMGGAALDMIYGDAGDDILLGDIGMIVLDNGSLVSVNTEGETIGGSDTIHGDMGDDIIMGGLNSSSDILYGSAGDDIILGDNGFLDFDIDDDPLTLDLVRSATDGFGGDDYIYGNAGDDVLIGGTGGDSIDGNGGKDLILGDNGVLTYMNGDTSNPRFRVLEGTVMYGETDGVDDEQLLINRDQQFNDPAGIPQWAIWEVMLSLNWGGADYIAGGPDNDQIFGQSGNDIIQGDGTIGLLIVSASVEDTSDGDDYIEGNDGDDIIFGNLGQDDIIGGSSGLFGLDEQTDGEDMIFGGAGTDLARNNEGDTSDNGHARDSDVILGDNGNIYRLVGTNGTYSGSFLEFNYDNYGTEKIIVRGTELLDYTPGGMDYDAVNAVNEIGAPDEIHGESGDDFLYGMKGDDVIFGEGQDDDIIGGYGNDWISGGTGDDGVLGDDGRIYTSRNGTAEPLYGIDDLAGELDKDIRTPDKKQQATINVSDELKKTVNLTPFKLGDPDPLYADDIIFGGLGNDFLHGGDGDDAISGAEALAEYYDNPFNPGNVLKFGVDREGEFGAYNKDDPLSKVYWDPDTGEFVTDGSGVEFLLNFNHTEGPAVNDDVNTDGDDVIFGDLGNDWLVGGTGRDHIYGGRGSDLLNADDNLDTAGGTNSEPNGSETSYEDLAYGGAGPDVLIANIVSDRLIDWVGDFNLYVLPYTSFGANTISRNIKPRLLKFLYDLSRSDGADQTLGDSDDPRNGEPNGELGLVMQKDPDWENQQTSDGDKDELQ